MPLFLKINSDVINLQKVEVYSLDSQFIKFEMDSGLQQVVDLGSEEKAQLCFEQLNKELGLNSPVFNEEDNTNSDKTKH